MARDGECADLVLEVPDWPGHRAGQHVDLRLTGPDGYTTERSYSLAAPVERSVGGWRIQLVVQRVADGEVSPYLTDVFDAGNLIEVRGRSVAGSCGRRARVAARRCFSSRVGRAWSH